MPPSSSTTHSTVAKPGIVSPASRRPITSGIVSRATSDRRKPSTVASCNGRQENDVIASSEKRSILRSVNFVCPAWRGSRSYGTEVCV
jgi:hypothetical protein